MVFWNARSIVKHKSELQNLLTNLDIFIGVETWLKPDIPFKHPGFSEVRQDRTGRPGGGILFLIRNDIKFTKQNAQANLSYAFESCTVTISNVVPSFKITACYRAPNTNPSQSDWDNFFSVVNDSEPHVVVGDFNAHSRMWNCAQDNSQGNYLCNSISGLDLILHNTNSSTHIDYHSGNLSNLDLIFSSNDISDTIQVEVLDDTWGSDHFPININIKTNKTIFRLPNKRLSSKKTDWLGYTKTMGNKFKEFLEPMYNNLNTADKYKFFISEIRGAISSNTPTKKDVSDRVHRNPVPWWDSECEKVIRLRKAAFKKWRYTLDPSDHIQFKKTVAIARKTINNKKRTSFRNFAETIDLSTNSSYVWNKCKIFKNKWANVKLGDKPSQNTEDKIAKALDKICPP